MKNGIVHIAWSCNDLERTKNFLSNVFDWKFEPWDNNYVLFTSPDGIGGGIRCVGDKNICCGDSPVVYIEVDNIDAYREKAKKHGGNAGETKKQIPNLGWVAFVTDPNGNLIGLVQRAG